MRSEFTANHLLQTTPSKQHHRSTADLKSFARYPQRRTLWGFIFFWL